MQAEVNTQMNDTANTAEAATVTDATANAAQLLETSFGNEQPDLTLSARTMKTRTRKPNGSKPKSTG